MQNLTQNVGIQIGKVLPDGSVDYNDPAVDGAYRKTIDTPLDEDNFTVLVKITYDKILPGGDSEERSAVYTLKVIRAPYDKSNAYLADLAVIEEDEPNNGKYELDKNYNKLIRLYETVIDYTDNSVSLVIKKEYENDTVLAQLGTENQVEMFTDIAQEFILPISFMEDDDATANIDFTVISPEADDVGYYRVVVRRSERAQSKIRLDNLVLDDGDTDLYDYDTSSTVIDPFDSETFKYSAIVQAGQESINILAASREPADTVIITHNGVSTENVDNVPNDYDLSTTSNEDIFFITVYSSLDETEKTTYVLKVIQQNTAFLTNLEVTDDNPDDEYYELDPEFEQNTISYTVKVPVLAQEIEFTATADTTDSAETTIAVKLDNVEIDRQVTDQLVTVARLDLSKTVYNFEFIITNDVGGAGRYKVKVIRDHDKLVSELQTTIRGNVNTVADGDNVATVSLYKVPNAQQYDVITDPDSALVEKVVTGADGEFEFSQETITAAGVGVYSITVRRAGYLTYYLSEIDVQESYARAMYDFGRIDLIPGDIVTTGDSHDIIDEKDLEYFKSMLAGTEYTMDEIFGDYADLYPDALAAGAVTTDDKNDTKAEVPTDDKTDDSTTKDDTTVDTPTGDKTDDSTTKDDTTVDTPTGDKTDDSTTKDDTTVDTPTGDKTDDSTIKDDTTVDTPTGDKTDDSTTKDDTTGDSTTKDDTTVDTPTGDKTDDSTTKDDTTVNVPTDSSDDKVSDSNTSSGTSDNGSPNSGSSSSTSDSGSSDSSASSGTSDSSSSDSSSSSGTSDSGSSDSDSSSNSYSGEGLKTAVMGVYDEVTEEVTETETPVAEEENVKEDHMAITTDAEITIVEDEVIVDDIEDADSELNTDSTTTPNVTPAQAMVDKKICDFNGDDKYNAKDRLYITTHRTIKAPNLNNRTDSSRILISAYTE